MDPSLAVWVVDSNPNVAPGLPALLGERARVDPAGTIYFKIGPLDTDWALTPGGGGVPSAPGDATYWVSTANATLTAEVDMGALTSGIIYQTVALGISTPAIVTIGTGLNFTAPTLRLADTTVTPGSYTYSSITVDQQGRLTAASSGAAPGPANAQYWVSTPDATLTAEVDMGALGSGVLRQITAVGVSTPSVFSHTATRIPFGSGTNGWTTDSANFTYNDATNTTLIGMGASTPVANAAMEVLKSQNAGTSFCFINPSAGASAYTAFFLGQSSDLATGATFGTFLFSSGSGFGAPYGPNIGLFELAGGVGNMHFWIQQNTGNFAWYTKTNFPAPATNMKMTLTNDGLFGVGNSGTFPAGTFAHFNRSTNGATYVNVSNANAGSSAQASVILSQSDTTYTNYLEVGILGAGFSTIGPYQASGAVFEHVTNTTAPMFFSAYGTQPINFYTTTSRTLRLNIATGGGITMSSLSAGGIVKSTAGLLGIASASDVAGAITWPAAGRILYSAGTAAAPIGNSAFQFDDSTRVLFMGSGSSQKWANLGNFGDANTEYVESAWNANVWELTSKKTGAGTVRSMYINADTATLTLNGGTVATTAANVTVTASADITHTATDDILLAAGDVMESYGTSQWIGGLVGVNTFATGNTVGWSLLAASGRTSGAAAVWNAFDVDLDVTIAGTTTIATAAGFNAVYLRAPGIQTSDAGVTVSFSAALYIENAPQAGANVMITNAYAVWVDAGLSRFDGNGTQVWELPADATAGIDVTIDGRIPILVGGATKYIRYYND